VDSKAEYQLNSTQLNQSDCHLNLAHVARKKIWKI